jgi:hypothetical protein
MPDDVDAAGPARSHAPSRRASIAERTSTSRVRLRRWAPVSALSRTGRDSRNRLIQPRGSRAQTCLWPLLTYQPCRVASSAMR